MDTEHHSAKSLQGHTLPDSVDAHVEAIPRELRIEIWRDECAKFEGTSAQLIAEGLIPESFKWPRAAAEKRWEANGYIYWLRRTRPDDHKGPMRSWLELDNWSIRVEVSGRDYAWRTRRALERKTEELRAEYYRHTAEGSRESSANWGRYWKAHQDKAFQAFKSRIPGLVPSKRGRKPKPAADGQAVNGGSQTSL